MGIALRFRLLLAFAAVALTAGAAAEASSIVVPSDASLVAKSDLIVIGRVLEARAVERNGKIWTESTILVEDRLKGVSDDIVTVREPGGELAGRTTVVFGSPEIVAGERALLFLTAAPADAYRIADLAAGKFSPRIDRAGTRFWFRDLQRSGLAVVGSREARPDLQREAAAFEGHVRGGAPDGRSYLRAFSDVAEGSVEADFALVSEPRVQRWFSFEDGAPAGWTALGRQTGYAGGGHQELAGAIVAWTACPGAKIEYFFAGESTVPPVGTGVANGVNEVFFNDPLDEISGSWNGRDGVVAVGGFDAILAKRPWAAGFAEDPSHPAGASEAWVIVEADVVVQDGIAPSRGMGSMALAEILAHELGHTLGLGHSSDPRALMYASLQNLGPYLREDDRRAARWLYPGPDEPASPPVLAAPSALAVSSVTSENVRLAWSDNASGEMVQTIYARPSGGAFAKLRDIAPNVTVANVTGLAPGREYELQITARGPADESSPSNIAVAAVPRPTLESAFTVGPPAGTAGITTFSFYDQSKGTIVSREWTFGDGASSAAAHPTHVFREAGSFEITLRVRDDRGEERTARRTVAVAAPPPLAADFTWAPGGVVAGEVILFADRSSGAPTDWTWSFGDGTASTERDPSKRFAAPGTYPVALEIADGTQTARISRSVDVAGRASELVSAEFAFQPAVPAVRELVRFAATGAKSADRWSWDFGDGVTSSDREPSHAYAEAGTYLVTLVVTRGETRATSRSLLLVQDDEPSHFVEGGSAEGIQRGTE
jgi:PKD repeat protein